MLDQVSIRAGLGHMLLVFTRPGLVPFLSGFPSYEEVFCGTLYLVILILAVQPPLSHGVSL